MERNVEVLTAPPQRLWNEWPVPFSALPVDQRYAKWGYEAADVEETHVALAPHLTRNVRLAQLAAVGGVHRDDVGRFLLHACSLTPAARARLRTWAAQSTTEIERPAYVIPESTKRAEGER